MNEQWEVLSARFQAITPREQFLIFISGLVIVIMLPFALALDENLQTIDKSKASIQIDERGIRDLNITNQEFEKALAQDPNKPLKALIESYKKRLSDVDEQLLELTDELISPIQMRAALIELLNTQSGVKLTSFEVLAAQPLIFSASEEMEELAEEDSAVLHAVDSEEASLGLYRHSIKLKLTGKYFAIRDYLQKLEDLKWKFFWHDFNYQLKEYPISELEIQIYSLSTDQEFIGV